MGQEVSPDIKPIKGSKLSRQDQALIEAGKAIVLESINVGRDFCKFMVGVATGAVPIYLGLVNLFLPDNYDFETLDRVYLAAPVFGFMVAAMIFIGAYMPTSEKFSIDVLESIEEHRASAIKRRSWLSYVGFGVFALSVIGAAFVVLFVIPDTVTSAS